MPVFIECLRMYSVMLIGRPLLHVRAGPAAQSYPPQAGMASRAPLRTAKRVDYEAFCTAAQRRATTRGWGRPPRIQGLSRHNGVPVIGIPPGQDREQRSM